MIAKQENLLKIGVLGCGPISQAGHFESVTKASNTELFAICDIAEDLLQRFGATYDAKRTYTNYDHMLADPEIDAIIIATADVAHIAYRPLPDKDD